MLPPHLQSCFESLYATDLVYQKDCWKLCGDAHCCNFRRYKAKVPLLAQDGSHDLPLLPGEFEFLESKGWQQQFQDFNRKQGTYDFGTGSVSFNTITSRRAGCVCDHDTRTVICRLYPLLPVFDLEGRLVGTEVIGLYEELEQLEGMAPACQISALPFDQVKPFLRICELLGSNSAFLFHFAAYRAAKRHVFQRLAEQKATTGKSAFALFQGAFVRRRLIDHPVLKSELAALKTAFDERHGARFTAEMEELQRAARGREPVES